MYVLAPATERSGMHSVHAPISAQVASWHRRVTSHVSLLHTYIGSCSNRLLGRCLIDQQRLRIIILTNLEIEDILTRKILKSGPMRRE